mmetsp:Transcript_13355/g.36867  ORF Transcript_13355/g.36867 Transcript_13355/m.36867 type:complete len:217 (+) Transcript_13355:2-652(+)
MVVRTSNRHRPPIQIRSGASRWLLRDPRNTPHPHSGSAPLPALRPLRRGRHWPSPWQRQPWPPWPRLPSSRRAPNANRWWPRGWPRRRPQARAGAVTPSATPAPAAPADPPLLRCSHSLPGRNPQSLPEPPPHPAPAWASGPHLGCRPSRRLQRRSAASRRAGPRAAALPRCAPRGGRQPCNVPRPSPRPPAAARSSGPAAQRSREAQPSARRRSG